MSKRKISDRALRALAREKLGYDELYPGQEDALHAVLEGHDTLAVMPTGAGKSAIYQLAGLVLDGPTIVISPLIALQRDQARSLEKLGVARVAVVNSTLSETERERAFALARARQLEYLFLAPEQFNLHETLAHLRAARPSLFVVDEAHCISQWGHGFRPEYLRLGAVVDALDHPRVLALTATAAPPVREEILRRLHMRRPRVIVEGFDRPNIELSVERFTDEASKKRALFEWVAAARRPGLIYAATKKHAEELAAALAERGIRAAPYHAGMKKSERQQAQEAFMQDELEVVVATVAFGMGVDKPNVHFVLHYDVSDSLDSYYQEIGRGGRDGEPAQAVLFYRPEDLGLAKFFSGQRKVAEQHVEQVASALEEHADPVSPDELSEDTGLSPARVVGALSQLEEVQAIETFATGEVALTAALADPSAIIARAASVEQRRQVLDRSRIEMISSYAETYACRREFLLNYFGEEYDPPCGRCDNCRDGRAGSAESVLRPFALNTRVVHAQFGDGLVQRYQGDRLWVLFDDFGYKMLLASDVAKEGLLQAAAE